MAESLAHRVRCRAPRLLLAVFAVGSISAATVLSGTVTREAPLPATAVALGEPHTAALASYSNVTLPEVGTAQPHGRKSLIPAASRGARAPARIGALSPAYRALVANRP